MMPEAIYQDIRDRLQNMSERVASVEVMYELFKKKDLIKGSEILAAMYKGSEYKLAEGVYGWLIEYVPGKLIRVGTRFEPFSLIPPHRHDMDEKVIIIEGELFDGDTHVGREYDIPAFQSHFIMSGANGAIIEVLFTYPNTDQSV